MSVYTPICDIMGIEYPVFLAGMGGVARPALAAAVSNAGGLGTMGGVSGPTREDMRAYIDECKRLTDKPIGLDMLAVNQEMLKDRCDVLIDGGVNVFVSGIGVPYPIIEPLHAAGIKIMVVCGAVKHAVAAAEAGVDAVVAQGTGAGGHTGRVDGMALIPQIVDAVDIPVLAAGSIYDGRGLAAALAFGAQGIWVGTRFIVSEEANAHQGYKERIIGARETDTWVTRCYSGKTMRVINNPYVADWESRLDEIKPMPEQGMVSSADGVMGPLRGDVASYDPMRDVTAAGQGSGGIHEILPAGEIVRMFVDGAEEALRKANRLVTSGAKSKVA